MLVPKDAQKNHHKFEAYIDRQSGEDSCFRIRKTGLWTGFLQNQEDLLHESARKLKFFLAENTGLQTSLVKVGDRSTERFVSLYS